MNVSMQATSITKYAICGTLSKGVRKATRLPSFYLINTNPPERMLSRLSGLTTIVSAPLTGTLLSLPISGLRQGVKGR